jgi:hypothetical protein
MRYAAPIALVVLVAGSVPACHTEAAADRSRTSRPALIATVPVGAASPARRDHPGACSLITQEEMRRILGGVVAEPEARGALTCTYRPDAPDALTPYAEVKIDWDGGEQAMNGMRLAGRAMAAEAGFSVFEKIDGVGDEASMMIGGVMNVRKGVMLITIDLRMQSEAKEKGSAIANTILARVTGAGATE